MNEATDKFPLHSLDTLCRNENNEAICDMPSFKMPTFCTPQCAYAFMLKNDYSESQIMCLLHAHDDLREANDPYILHHPFRGPLRDIDIFRQHQQPGAEVPFAHRFMYKQDVVDGLLQSFHERKELLDKVTKTNKK